MSGCLNDCSITAAGQVQMSAPMRAASRMCIGDRTDATRISVVMSNCPKISTMCWTIVMPSVAISSSRPTNGLTYDAPALAANIACTAEKIKVVLILIPSLDRPLIALMPSRVNGILTMMCSSIFASSRPSAIIAVASVDTTSALVGPFTSWQIFLMMSRGLPPSLAISDGLVVTPSMMPSGTRDSTSLTLPVSMKIFMSVATCPPPPLDWSARRRLPRES